MDGWKFPSAAGYILLPNVHGIFFSVDYMLGLNKFRKIEKYLIGFQTTGIWN